jgi:hypothetical protein
MIHILRMHKIEKKWQNIFMSKILFVYSVDSIKYKLNAVLQCIMTMKDNNEHNHWKVCCIYDWYSCYKWDTLVVQCDNINICHLTISLGQNIY